MRRFVLLRMESGTLSCPRDTGRAMSQENVETFKRAVEAFNRRDINAVLEELDPEVEWHPLFHLLLGGEATVYRGHEGYREFVHDVFEVFAEIQIEYSEVRDLGDRLLAIDRLRVRGKESGAETESPVGYIVDVKNGKAVRVIERLDPKEALEAAGVEE
jgi:ketosteroid isomerase-like protein